MPMDKRNKRTTKRVVIEHEHEVNAVAIDGTWSVAGRLKDVSEGGAKLFVFDNINERMRNEEFFLTLTADGKVSRRAKLLWELKQWIGVRFVVQRH